MCCVNKGTVNSRVNNSFRCMYTVPPRHLMNSMPSKRTFSVHIEATKMRLYLAKYFRKRQKLDDKIDQSVVKGKK